MLSGGACTQSLWWGWPTVPFKRIWYITILRMQRTHCRLPQTSQFNKGSTSGAYHWWIAVTSLFDNMRCYKWCTAVLPQDLRPLPTLNAAAMGYLPLRTWVAAPLAIVMATFSAEAPVQSLAHETLPSNTYAEEPLLPEDPVAIRQVVGEGFALVGHIETPPSTKNHPRPQSEQYLALANRAKIWLSLHAQISRASCNKPHTYTLLSYRFHLPSVPLYWHLNSLQVHGPLSGTFPSKHALQASSAISTPFPPQLFVPFIIMRKQWMSQRQIIADLNKSTAHGKIAIDDAQEGWRHLIGDQRENVALRRRPILNACMLFDLTGIALWNKTWWSNENVRMHIWKMTSMAGSCWMRSQVNEWSSCRRDSIPWTSIAMLIKASQIMNGQPRQHDCFFRGHICF